jgi:hypothetical protein
MSCIVEEDSSPDANSACDARSNKPVFNLPRMLVSAIHHGDPGEESARSLIPETSMRGEVKTDPVLSGVVGRPISAKEKRADVASPACAHDTA